MNYSKEVQEFARDLFSGKKIDIFIGYQAGPVETNDVPLIVTGPSPAGACGECFGNPTQIDKLVFTEKSIFNLTNYLKFEHFQNKRVGIVVKGCDSRALNLLLTENQIKRENLSILGINCSGVIDENGVKFQNCEECVSPDPVVFDRVLGSGQGRRKFQPNADVVKHLERNLTERGEFFQRVFEACIRCNACRNSCPLCYCRKCSIEENSTFTCDQANTVPNAGAALITWALHLAGRCVDCRNCEKACPKGLPLHLLHKRNEMVIHENFAGHLSGIEEKDPGVLYKFDYNDNDEFIL